MVRGADAKDDQHRRRHVLAGVIIAVSSFFALVSTAAATTRLRSFRFAEISGGSRKSSTVQLTATTDANHVRSTHRMPQQQDAAAKAKQDMFHSQLLQCQQEGEIVLKDVAKFVPVDTNSSSTHHNQYDFLSCPVMRPRYNCHHSDPNFYPKGFRPTDWKMVLTHGDRICDLSTLVHAMDGPKGLAEHVQHRGVYNVLLAGDSQVGQLWEALVCAWQSQVTNMKVQLLGKAFRRRPGTEKFPFKGQLIPYNININNTTEGCRSQSPETMNNFLDDGAQVPSTHAHCDDDVAMVEFGHSLRFYYIHRPDMYRKLQDVTDALGLALQDIDQLVVNSLGANVMASLEWPSRMKQDVWERRLDWNTYPFKTAQERDIGRWFGADNRGVNKDDGSPGCMPGPVDDQVNLLLYQMWTGSLVTMHGFTA